MEVLFVTPGGLAERLGFREGDCIPAVGHKSVRGMEVEYVMELLAVEFHHSAQHVDDE